MMNCTSHTEETSDTTNTILSNGKTLEVEKITRITSIEGIISKHTYAVLYDFEYNLLIKEDKIKWETQSGEPKNIIFCRDTTYIRSLKEKTIRTEYFDSIDSTTTYKRHFEIQESFQKHIGKRYFFKLLGDDF